MIPTSLHVPTVPVTLTMTLAGRALNGLTPNAGARLKDQPQHKSKKSISLKPCHSSQFPYLEVHIEFEMV